MCIIRDLANHELSPDCTEEETTNRAPGADVDAVWKEQSVNCQIMCYQRNADGQQGLLISNVNLVFIFK